MYKKLRKRAALMTGLAMTVSGCAGIPKIGEFHEKTVVSFPHHPIVTLLHGGIIYSEENPSGVNFWYEHWTGINGGRQHTDWPLDSTDHGSNSWGSLLGSYSNVRWRDIRDNRHYMQTTSYNNNLTKVTTTEFYELTRKNNKWKKTKLGYSRWGKKKQVRQKVIRPRRR